MSKIKLMLCLSTLVFLSACSSSMNSRYAMDMTGYEDQIYNACMQSGQYNNKAGEVDDDTRYICRSHAKRNIKTSESYYDLYKSDAIEKKCTGVVNKEKCVLDIRKAYYDDMIPSFIQKIYPEKVK